MKTFSTKLKNINHNWYYVDATNKILGRFSTELVKILQGKHKLEYVPHIDTGDYIIVLNAEKVIVTGKKYFCKFYYHHTGYIGGIKKISFKEMLTRHPERIIELSVKGMLPKNQIGRSMYRKLRVLVGNQYKQYIAQKPKFLSI